MKRGIYQHYKGGFYYLHFTAKLEATGEAMAVYTDWFNFGRHYTRPLAEFAAEVDDVAREVPCIHGATRLRGPGRVQRFRLVQATDESPAQGPA